MQTKVIIAGIIAGVVSFLLGWVLWGMLLMDYYEANMIVYEGMEKDPMNMLGMVVSQLSGGLLIAYIIGNAAGAMNWKRGATIGLYVGFFMTLMMTMYFFAFFNWYANNTILVVDLLLNTAFTALLGAIVGWYLGRGTSGA